MTGANTKRVAFRWMLLTGLTDIGLIGTDVTDIGLTGLTGTDLNDTGLTSLTYAGLTGLTDTGQLV